MRSVTSCFNPTLYKKNLARFWPLWGLWLLGWLCVYPLNMLVRRQDYLTREMGEMGSAYFLRCCVNMNEVVPGVSVFLGAVYAVMVTMAVFGYLYNHRSAATIHALPLRRETLFFTNYLSGLTFILMPNVIAYGLAAAVEMAFLPGELAGFGLSALWQSFWVSSAIYVFFYGFAVFCAQFTGNILALPAFYGILNFLTIAMYNLIAGLGDSLFYGGWPFSREPLWVVLTTPGYALVEATQWEYWSTREVWDPERNRLQDLTQLEMAFRDPATIAGFAVAGVVLAGLALVVYRRRHIETAGDVVSVKWVRPVFRIGVAVCAGLSGGVMMSAFFGWYNEKAPLAICVLLWTAVGYLAAEMLLQKSFRVLKKCWRGCLVTVSVMSVFILACYVDVLGVETWVPDPAEVKEVRVSMNSTYPYDSGSHMGLSIEDPIHVEKIVNLHQAIIKDQERFGEMVSGDNWLWVDLNYQTTGGMYTKRYNMVPIFQSEINDPTKTTGIVHDLFNDRAMVERLYDLERGRMSQAVSFRLMNVKDGYGQVKTITFRDGAEEVWQAVLLDFADGNLGKRYLFEDDVRRANTYYTDLNLRFLDNDMKWAEMEEVYIESYDAPAATVEDMEGEMSWNWSMDVTLTPQATRTLRALEQYAGLGSEYQLVTHDEKLEER